MGAHWAYNSYLAYGRTEFLYGKVIELRFLGKDCGKPVLGSPGLLVLGHVFPGLLGAYG
jgi:hypothetical protein